MMQVRCVEPPQLQPGQQTHLMNVLPSDYMDHQRGPWAFHLSGGTLTVDNLVYDFSIFNYVTSIAL